MAISYSGDELVRLIDDLAPINNRFRTTSDPLSKIELMWDFGAVLNKYMGIHGLKLHELLYKIYDPYSKVKMSYITRDLGSYSYRINQYFRQREEISKTLNGLQSYSVFREAVPLLFNPKYKLSEDRKKEILGIVVSSVSPKTLISNLREIKKQIIPLSNPRNQRAGEYGSERDYLLRLHDDLKTFYGNNQTVPSDILVNEYFGSPKTREAFVIVLMALASEAFLKKIDDVDPNLLNQEMKGLLEIVESNTQKRARFRKWVMSSNELLKLAEGIHSLDNESDYKYFKEKCLMTNQ